MILSQYDKIRLLTIVDSLKHMPAYKFPALLWADAEFFLNVIPKLIEEQPDGIRSSSSSKNR